MKIYKVIICGDRNYIHAERIRREIRKLKRWCERQDYTLLVIEGGAPGADRLAKHEGHREGVHVAEVDALWYSLGRPAGPIRNEVMALLEPAEIVAFHKDYENSKGTKNMLRLAKKLGIPNRLIED
jgi:hypothetical protein